MSLPTLADPARFALFCDFDGTLVDIAATPDQVRLSGSTRRAIALLFHALGGALAIISGRDIATIDRLLEPLRLPAAGTHGLVRRDAAGTVHGSTRPHAGLERVAARLEAFAAGRPGLLVEHKSGAVTLHFRVAPHLEAACVGAARSAIADTPTLAIRRGKMNVEVAPHGADKGAAIAAFMAEPPFGGRLPVFAGDDTTDEDGFAAVNRMGGISIKIGSEPSSASHRAGGTPEFLDWFTHTARRLARSASA